MKNCNFTIVSYLSNMDKIKSHGVHNEYTGEASESWLVSGMKFVDTEDHAKPTIKVRSFKDCTLMLNEY